MNATTDIKNATTTTRSAAEEEDLQHALDDELLDRDVRRTTKIKTTEDRIAAIDEYYAPKKGMGNCCLCKGLMSNAWGNNPAPLRKRGKCCDKCNVDKVIPTRMGGMMEMGTHEEQILKTKIFVLMGDVREVSEPMWEQDYAPFNKIKREYRDLVIARGLFPHIDWRKRSISFTVIADMMKDEWDKQNMTYESNDLVWFSDPN